mmetsp:Transcript_23392/g.56476  ORF Transcript_23392/g.56476 Transcript_23392/m.56476 type:complete len:214 (-) Transcript_23392:942-1583(-)
MTPRDLSPLSKLWTIFPSLNPVFPPKTLCTIGYAPFASAVSAKSSISLEALTALPSASRAGIATPPISSKPLKTSLFPSSVGRRPTRGTCVEKYFPADAGAVPAPTSLSCVTPLAMRTSLPFSARAMAMGTYSASLPDGQSTTSVPLGRSKRFDRRNRCSSNVSRTAEARDSPSSPASFAWSSAAALNPRCVGGFPVQLPRKTWAESTGSGLM